MLGWVGALINKSWLDRERQGPPSERKPRCGRGQVRKEGHRCRLIGPESCRLKGEVCVLSSVVFVSNESEWCVQVQLC